jgi:O-antigen ligase
MTLFLAFSLWYSLSFIWSPNYYDAVWDLFLLLTATGIIICASQIDDLRPLYIGLTLGIVVSFPLGGFYPNKDLAGEASAMLIAVILALSLNGQWKLGFLVLPLVTILFLSQSRSGWLGLLVVGFFIVPWIWLRLVYFIVLGSGVVLAVWHSPGSMNERIAIWSDTIKGVTFFGNGLGSFWTLFPYLESHGLPVRPADAHNELLNIVFEQGLIGGFLVILMLWFVMAAGGRDAPPERALLACALPIALVEFPFHTPLGLFLVCCAVGRLVSGPVVLPDPHSSRLEDDRESENGMGYPGHSSSRGA